MPDPVISAEEFGDIVKGEQAKIIPAAPPPPATPPATPPTPISPANPAPATPPADDVLFIPEDIVPTSKPLDPPKPGEKPAAPETELTAASIDVNTFPEKMRPNVGAMRKKLEHFEDTLKEIEAAGVKIERGPDGKLKIIVPKGDDDAVKLRQELDERDAAIGKLSLVDSPSFKAKFVKPINDNVAMIYQTALGLAGEDIKTDDDKKLLASQIQQLAGMSPSQRAATIHKQFPDLAGTLIPMFMQTDVLIKDRNSAVEQWKQTRQMMQEQEQNFIHAKTKEVKGRLKDEAISEASQNGYFMLKKSTGTDPASKAWNDRVDAIHGAIGTFFEDPDPVIASQAFVRAAASEYLLGLTQAQSKLISDLKGKLRAYGHTEAGIGSGGGDGERRKGPSGPMSADAALKEIMGNLPG